MINFKSNHPFRLIILMPVYNDWEPAKILIEEIDKLTEADICLRILLIDDGSTKSCFDYFHLIELSNITHIEVMQLNRNLGHQRALAIGIAHVYKNMSSDAVLIMDSDGEDKAEDVFRLLDVFNKKEKKQAVFAKRVKRVEGLFFHFCYRFYLFLNWILIGRIFKVGNFSIIPYDYLAPLVLSSELWNHYAATVFKLDLQVSYLPLSRGIRLRGKSKMSFVSLVIHGFSAISVFGEVIGTRALVALFCLGTVTILLTLALLGMFLHESYNISNFLIYGMGLILLLLFDILLMVSSFLLSILGNRNLATFLPVRDYIYYIKEINKVFPV